MAEGTATTNPIPISDDSVPPGDTETLPPTVGHAAPASSADTANDAAVAAAAASPSAAAAAAALSRAGGEGGSSFPAPAHNVETFRLETADSGVFLVMATEEEGGGDGWDDPIGASVEWERLAERGRDLATRGELPGFDPATMEVQPMRANPAWGKDMGPHFSLVSVVGAMGTADADGRPDPFVLGGDDGKRKSIAPEVGGVRPPREGWPSDQHKSQPEVTSVARAARGGGGALGAAVHARANGPRVDLPPRLGAERRYDERPRDGPRDLPKRPRGRHASLNIRKLRKDTHQPRIAAGVDSQPP